MYSYAQWDELVIKYVGEQGSSIEVNICAKRKELATAYFENKWVKFDKRWNLHLLQSFGGTD